MSREKRKEGKSPQRVDVSKVLRFAPRLGLGGLEISFNGVYSRDARGIAVDESGRSGPRQDNFRHEAPRRRP
jgi:hypothetical protein